jgi:hypothetical protein
MTEGNYPGGPSSTPGYGESDQGYGPRAGQSAGGYGAPAGYGAPGGDPYATPTRRDDTIGVAGMIIAAIGIAAMLVSFLALKWEKGGPDSKFSKIHDALSAGLPGVNGLSKAYFGWLGWALLVVVAVIALAANLPTPVSPALRILGLLLGLGGAVVTLFAIKVGSNDSFSYDIKHGGIGYWVAIAGFVVAGIGAVIGPQRN